MLRPDRSISRMAGGSPARPGDDGGSAISATGIGAENSG